MRKRVLFVAVASIAGVLSAVADDPPRHPQDEAIVRAPRPYRDEEVSFRNERGSVQLAGTMSLPDGKGPFPAVLLIAASGPEGRDEEVAGHRVFMVLADHCFGGELRSFAMTSGVSVRVPEI